MAPDVVMARVEELDRRLHTIKGHRVANLSHRVATENADVNGRAGAKGDTNQGLVAVDHCGELLKAIVREGDHNTVVQSEGVTGRRGGGGEVSNRLA